MTSTTLLGLPLIDASQAQKHVTHNAALLQLDGCVQLAALARNMSTPPASPNEADRYVVGANPTGTFATHTNHIALWQDGAWVFLIPQAGWCVYIIAENSVLAYTGSAWALPSTPITALQNLTSLSVGTGTDSNNPLSVKLNSTLWTARATTESGTGDMRMVLNKSATGNTVSQLYQTNYSGRAETGLSGDDHFRIKVSPDGNTWRAAMDIDPTTGLVSFPIGIGAGLPSATPQALRNRILNGNFAINQRGYVSGTAMASGTYTHDRWTINDANTKYTFTQNAPQPFGAPTSLDTQITIVSGSLMQVIEPRQIEGGVYTLSWSGTSQALVQYWTGSTWMNAGGWAPSPMVLSAIPAGATVIVLFGSGTLGQVQLEPGNLPTAFEHRPYGLELALCQRYFETGYARNRMFTNGVGVNSIGSMHKFQVTKRAVPTITLTNQTYANAANAVAAAATLEAFIFVNDSPGGNPITDASATYAASAEL